MCQFYQIFNFIPDKCMKCKNLKTAWTAMFVTTNQKVEQEFCKLMDKSLYWLFSVEKCLSVLMIVDHDEDECAQ